MEKEKFLVTRKVQGLLWPDQEMIEIPGNGHPEFPVNWTIGKEIFTGQGYLEDYLRYFKGSDLGAGIIRLLYSPSIMKVVLQKPNFKIFKMPEVKWEDLLELIGSNELRQFIDRQVEVQLSPTYLFGDETNDINLDDLHTLLDMSGIGSEISFPSKTRLVIETNDPEVIETLDPKVLLAFRRYFLAEGREVELVVEGGEVDNSKLR